MKKLTVCAVLLTLFGLWPRAQAQDSLSYQVNAIQYFFDTDPGLGVPGNGGIINTSPADSISQQLGIVVPLNMSDGVHHLYMRVRDTSLHWSLVQRKAFYVMPNFTVPPPTSTSTNVVAVQYYFNQEPGLGVAGNGAVMAITPDSAISKNLSVALPSSLPLGVNHLYMRVQDQAGNWSLVDRKAFYIMEMDSVPAQSLAGEVTTIQYYFNDDPGFGVAGNGAVVPVPADSSISENLAINLPSNLPEGVNHLYFRVKDQFGNWSLVDRRTFYIMPSLNIPTTTVSTQITALEYFFDNDPGVGNGTQINVAATDSLAGAFELVTPCLDTGTHYFFMRAMDSYGNWSLIDRDTIEVSPGSDIQTHLLASDSLAICPGDSVELFFSPLAGVSYQWLLNGSVLPGEDSTHLLASVSGIYSVQASCNGGSTVSDSIEVSYIPSSLYYADKDGDGFGDPMDTIRDCSLPPGYVLDSTDCNDLDSLINPSAVEICDGVDNNCNGQIDEGLFVNASGSLSFCQGDSVLLGGAYRSTTGFYPDTLFINDACDTIFLVALTINPTDTVYLTGVSCDSTEAGMSSTTLTSQYGCDSVVIETITYDPGDKVVLSPLEICEGYQEFFFGNYYDMAGLYYDTLQNINGCDSILVQELIVNPNDTVFMTMTTGDPNQNGVVDTTYLVNQNYCDSLVITTKVYVSGCTNDTVYRNFTTCDSTEDGVFITTLTNQGGCDSVIIDTITLDPGSITQLPAMRLCDGDSVLVFGRSQSMAGIYYDTLANVNGCDSILVKQLLVDPVYSTTLPGMSICQGDSMMIFGMWQSISGTYYDSLQTANGCDSIVSKTLSVDALIYANGAMDVCEGDSTFVGGSWQTMAGTYYDTLIATNGCDSIVATSVTVKPTVLVTTTDSICDGDSVLIGGMYQNMPGTYPITYTGGNGCDSTLVTILYYKDSADCPTDTGTVSLVCVSDASWMKSTVVTSTNLSGSWGGVNGYLPPAATFTQPAMTGQPYPWPHLHLVDGSDPIKTESDITYFRKEFTVGSNNDLKARFRMTVDDQSEVYINRQLVVRIDDFGRICYHGPQHDALFESGTVTNPYNVGDAYGFTTGMSLGSIVLPGTNELIVVVRNLGKSHDRGGFSFRMDLGNSGSPVPKSAVAGIDGFGLMVYPNPAKDYVTVSLAKVTKAEARLMLYDFSGKLLYSKSMVNSTELDLSTYSQGVYMVKVISNGQTFTQKVVRE